MNLSSASPSLDTQVRGREASPVMSPKAFYAAIGETIGINRIYDLLRANRIRHVKIGNRFLILRSEVMDFFLRESEASIS